MKKIILVAIAFLGVLTSCSSDDDNPAVNNVDPIVGTWKYSKVTVDGTERPLDDCEKQSTYVFTAEGQVANNSFEEFQSKCKSDNTAGTWKKDADGTYTGTFTDDVETYTTDFKLVDGELVIEDDLEPIIDIYRK